MSRVLIFMSKMLIIFQSTLSSRHHALWTGGRGTARLYKEALQRAGFFVPFWSLNGCTFPPLRSETENGSQENHKSVLKHFCLKLTMFRNSILVRCYQQDLGNVYD